MVSSILKALGAVVVGTPVAALLGLTARSIRKQEDAQVPVIRSQEAPLTVTIFTSWLDRRTHEHLAPTSFKKGYVSYDVRVENRSGQAVRGVHVELLDTDGDVVSVVRLGEIAPRSSSAFTAKRSWVSAFEAHRTAAVSTVAPIVLTWKSSVGRRRVVLAPAHRRVLGPSAGSVRRGRRSKPPVTAQVLS